MTNYENLTSFPAGVRENLKFYIYRLIDPRDGSTFYIGKGRGDRVFQHATALDARAVAQDAALDLDNDDPQAAHEEALDSQEERENLKIDIIRQIHGAGLKVIHVIHRHGMENAETAYEVEAALIDAYAGLANKNAGQGSTDRGPMHAWQIVNKYALPSVEPRSGDKLILININSWEDIGDEELLDRVRYAWRISKHRAEKADYVLAVTQGVVRGVFVPEKWLPATPEHFPPPRFEGPRPPRIGFHGKKAPADIWIHYVGASGKRLPEHMRNRGKNPVRYYNL